MFKRTFDILASGLGLILLAPLLILIALLVRVGSEGPTFYRARRVGRHGQEFLLYKFRTMVANADRQGPGITTAGDTRITRIGALLRRSKIDELPQLWNVLKGDMSLVGPRPEEPRYVALYTPEQRRVLEVRPGITSYASVRYRHEEAMLSGPDWEAHYIQTIMPAKLALDMVYVEDPTLLRDLNILLATGLSLFAKHEDAPLPDSAN